MLPPPAIIVNAPAPQPLLPDPDAAVAKEVAAEVVNLFRALTTAQSQASPKYVKG